MNRFRNLCSKEMLFPAGLVMLVAVVYAQVLHFGFVSLDDYMYVRDNPRVLQGITLDGLRWAFTSFYAGNWHPLTWLSHMADVELFGLNPGMHHVTSVAFHALNTLLLYIVLKKMTREMWKSLAVAALFALHPLHVESAAWVSERKDVLSTFFWMLTLLSYAWYVRGRSIKSYLAVMVSFALGLMAKPMLVTLPFVLLLMDFWPLRRPEIVQGRDAAGAGMRWPGVLPLVYEKIPFFVIAGAASLMTMAAQRSGGAVNTLETLPFLLRMENALISYVAYMGKMIWPLHLAAFYPYPRTIDPFLAGGALLLLAGVTFLAVRTVRRSPYLLVGWLWYLGTLAPVIGIIQVGSQSMADRYTYIPLTGIFIMIAWGLPQLAGRWSQGKALLVGASIIAASLLLISTWVQVGYWKDSITLFSHAIDVTRDNYVAHNSLGVALCDRGEYAAGMEHYREALRMDPGNVPAGNNLGAVLVRLGKYQEAADQFRRIVRNDPNHASAYYNLGYALLALGRVGEAIPAFRSALRLDPGHADAARYLNAALKGQQKMDLDINRLKDALSAEPQNAVLHYKLAELYRMRGDRDQALAHYQDILAMYPDSVQVLHASALLHAERGELDKALLPLKRILKLRPDDPNAYYNIACILARQGRNDEALECLTAAVGKGFSDRKSLMNDPDLDGIRGTQRYRELMNLPDH